MLSKSKENTRLNLLFICVDCHKPCIATYNSWCEDHDSISNILNNCKIVISNVPCTNCSYFQIFKKYETKLNNNNFYHLPLCNFCVNKFMAMFNAQIELYESYCSYIIRHIDKNSQEVIPRLFSNVQEIHFENRKFLEAQRSQRASKIYSNSVNKENHQEAPIQPRIPERKSKPTGNSNGINSLLLCATFNISFNRLYGTINGQRIGTRTPDNVPLNENDGALIFLCQMILYIAQIVNVKVNDMRLKQYMELKTKNDNQFVEVRFPDFEKHNKMRKFNMHIDHIFEISSRIFRSEFLESRLTFTVPHEINLNDKTIGGKPFNIDKKRPYEFTHAMKMLLVNFKAIQSLALKHYILSIS